MLISLGIPSQSAAWIALAGPEVIALAMILFGAIHYVGVGLINTIGLMFWALIPSIYVLRTQKLIPVILAHYINDFLTFAILIPLTFHPR